MDIGGNMLLDKIKSRLNFKFPYTYSQWVEMGMPVENYHSHTTWSDFYQIDSGTSLEQLMAKTCERNGTMLFSGEHGYPGEWMKVYDLCQQSKDEKFRKKNGLTYPLKFRYSVEIYWVKDPTKKYSESYTTKKGEIKTREKLDNANCHMMIVARTYNAMRKLNYLVSVANELPENGGGYYYRPRVGLEQVLTLSPDEVYVTSACVAGWKYPDADDIWLRVFKHFGNSFFLEYQAHNTDKQKALNKHIYELSQKYGIQTIVGLDTHYIDDEDCVKRENLLIRKNIHYDDEEGWYMDYPDGKTLFKRMKEQGVLPEDEIIYAMMNTHIFSSGCEDVTLDTDFKIPIIPEYQNLTYDERADKLHELLLKKYNEEDEEHRTKDRYEGMEYEFGQIKDGKSVDYFLDNEDIVRTATSPKFGGILTKTSRGSAASYYCSKLLGFTTLDRFEAETPIYPERFFGVDRIKAHQMPDCDFNLNNQKPFVEATRSIFGEHSCYPLLAVGTLKEKSAFKLYAGVKGLDPQVANEVTSEIDAYNEAVKNADDDDKDSFEIEKYIKDPYHLKLYKESIPYQSIIENCKVHACGHILFNGNVRQKDVAGYGDVRYEIGLIRCHSESSGKSTLVANVEGTLLDTYGYVKNDYLLVDTVSLIDEMYSSVGMKVPTVAELRKMVDGDKPTWDIYAKGATCCINQCEKQGTRQKVMRFKPQNVKEMACFVAAIRPGFKSLVNDFLDRKPYTCGEPAIDELTKGTFNRMLMQESLMAVYNFLGIPMQDAYSTIKKISKKKLKGEALQKVKDTLKEHWLEKIGNLDNFDNVMQVIEDSGR